MLDLMRAIFSWDLLSWFRGPDGQPRLQRYLLVALLGSVLVWAMALLMLWLVPRTWAVEYSLILPSSDPDGRVNLKDVGQAYATARATYDGKSLDPRVNYREIMLNPDVIAAAASSAKLPAATFGVPRIKLIDQSSVMEVQVQGPSAQEALRKAMAMQRAFEQRLEDLRSNEAALREQAIEQTIVSSRHKLLRAQQDLLRFKVESRIISARQLEELAATAGALEQRSIQVHQRLASDEARVRSLSTQLGLTPQQAGWTLTLQADALFMESFRQHGGAFGQLTEAAHKWGDAHPKVREAQGVLASSEGGMLQRARYVLAQPIESVQLRRLALILQDRSRDLLLNDLVTASAAAAAARAERGVVLSQQAEIEARMPGLAEEAARLDELQSRVSFTEAVFTGVAGKTDIGNANPYSSYPLVQTLVEPVLPTSARSPKPLFVGLGAMGATLMLLVGLTLAWRRAKA